MKTSFLHICRLAVFAAVAIPVSQAYVFDVGASETTIFEDNFSTSNGWTLNDGMAITGGELTATGNLNWMTAVRPFSSPIDLSAQTTTIYFSGRTDRSLGEERAKLYLRLNLTAQSGLIEQYNITMNLRPAGTGGFWPLYVDPGFNIDHTVETLLRPVANTFPTTGTYESFKLSLTPLGNGALLATPSYWNASLSQWQLIEGQTDYGAENVSPVTFSSAHLNGNSSAQSLEFQFFEAIPAIDEVLITGSVAAIPEAGTFLLPAGALAAALLRLSRRRRPDVGDTRPKR